MQFSLCRELGRYANLFYPDLRHPDPNPTHPDPAHPDLIHTTYPDLDLETPGGYMNWLWVRGVCASCISEQAMYYPFLRVRIFDFLIDGVDNIAFPR